MRGPKYRNDKGTREIYRKPHHARVMVNGDCNGGLLPLQRVHLEKLEGVGHFKRNWLSDGFFDFLLVGSLIRRARLTALNIVFDEVP